MLGLIIVVFVFTSVAPDSDWADSTLVLLESLTLVHARSGLRASLRADSKISLGLVALATASAWRCSVFGGNVLPVGRARPRRPV